mgnify:CR=1 FL=1
MEGIHVARLGDDGLAIVIAPGTRQAELHAVLTALASTRHGVEVRACADLYELPQRALGRGRLIVDAEHVSGEDIGWIRRILAGRPGYELVVVGNDAGARAARALLGLARARWLALPPDLDQLMELVSGTAASAGVGASTTVAAPIASGALATLVTPAAPAAPGPVAAFGIAREQVALLADIAQRMELAFAALRESGRLTDADLESPSIEIRRLLRYTRTLSCLLSPPPRGDEQFDLAGLVEEQLAALTLRGRKGPRFQPRSGESARSVEFLVRADRAAVALAFEALLQLARHCATAGETVRVVYTPRGTSELLIAIEFPAGPLAGLTSEKLADAAVLRERLPELGPNDLAASAAIKVFSSTPVTGETDAEAVNRRSRSSRILSRSGTSTCRPSSV